MEPTAELEAFCADPRGRTLTGDSWIYYCVDAELYGILLWGRPGAESAARLVRALAHELDPGIAPHQSLVDASRVDGIDAEAFEVLARYVSERSAELAARVTRLALVRPASGVTAAAVAGFYAALEAPPYPVSIFDDAAPALEWLERSDAAAAIAEVAAAQREISGVAPVVAALRGALRARLVDCDLAAAAKALSTSPRSLQRQLQAAGTTFGRELAATRIREAKRRMRESEAPLTRIALDVGFTSLSHFSTQFRRHEGESPTAWRARVAPTENKTAD